jgi:hypothetical protein
MSTFLTSAWGASVQAVIYGKHAAMLFSLALSFQTKGRPINQGHFFNFS